MHKFRRQVQTMNGARCNTGSSAAGAKGGQDGNAGTGQGQGAGAASAGAEVALSSGVGSKTGTDGKPAGVSGVGAKKGGDRVHKTLVAGVEVSTTGAVTAN